MTAASRVQRKPISIPSGVEVKIVNQLINIKGPKGQAELGIHPFVSVGVEDGHVKVQPNTEGKHLTGANGKLSKSIPGTMRSQIANIIDGVTKGFERKLVLVGVGYRAQAKGKVLALSLGFSHPVEFPVPAGITIETPTQTEILVKGVNKELVGLVAAKIRAYKSPEPYKGKGVRYANEVVEIKETKKK